MRPDAGARARGRPRGGAGERHARDRGRRRPGRACWRAASPCPTWRDALKAANQLTPVGRYPRAGMQYLVLASGLWTSAPSRSRRRRSSRQGRDACASPTSADVFPGAPDRTVLVTGNGRPAAVVNVSQQLGANILDVRDGVRGTLARAGAQPARRPRTSPRSTTSPASWPTPSAACATPSSSAACWRWSCCSCSCATGASRWSRRSPCRSPSSRRSSSCSSSGETINLMSMGGLAVAIGLVIDDAVVVVENIHRHLAHGEGATRSRRRRRSWWRRWSARRSPPWWCSRRWASCPASSASSSARSRSRCRCPC